MLMAVADEAACTRTSRTVLVADASDLRLPPGVWPQLIQLKTEAGPVTFDHPQFEVDGGNLVAVLYRATSGSGDELRVLND